MHSWPYEDYKGAGEPAPIETLLSGPQRLIAALIIDGLADFQKFRRKSDRQWLLQDAMYLCCYLPERVATRKKIVEAVIRIEAGEHIQFNIGRK